MAEVSSLHKPSVNHAPRLRWDARPWLLCGPGGVFFLVMLGVPLVMTVVLSLYGFSYTEGLIETRTLASYREALVDPYFHEIFLRTYALGVGVTLICVVLGAPEAYVISKLRPPWRTICLLAALGPLLVSVIVRTLGWVLLLGNHGLVTEALRFVGLTDRSLMYTHTGMVIALVHVFVPFMVISVWAALKKVDPATEQTALSLGASKFTMLRRVVLPQVLPGILSGSLIVFALTASAFATPAIIGERRLKVAATAIYDEYLSTSNWPLGAALAMILLVLNAVVIFAYNRLVERRYRKTLGEA